MPEKSPPSPALEPDENESNETLALIVRMGGRIFIITDEVSPLFLSILLAQRNQNQNQTQNQNNTEEARRRGPTP